MNNKEYIDPLDYEKNKKIIFESNLFDEDYYLKHNPDVEKSGRDPLTHWIENGYKESRNPNIRFNNKFYKSSYLTEENWNSLTHFIRIGKSLGYKTNFYENTLMEYDSSKINKICNSLNKKVSIFLLIFEIEDNLKECISSIVKNTKINYELILLSNEKLPEEVYSIFNELDINFTIKENNEDNFLSFVINNIFLVENDIVIMNNYAYVSPNWLNQLIIKSYSHDEIDISCPLSNLNTRINSPHEVTNKEFCLTKEGINDLFNKFSLNMNISSNYIDASCFFIKNESLNKFINEIPNIIFNCEKKVFKISMSKNLKCIIDDATYIHIDEGLFSAKNMFLPVLNKKDNLNWENSDLIILDLPQNIKNNLQHIVNNFNGRKLFNRILFIIDEQDAKIYHDFLFNRFLGIYECYFLTINANEISLWKDSNKINVWKNNSEKFSITNNTFYEIYFNIINSFKIDLIQITTLEHNSFDFLEICKLMKIPIVFYDDSQFIKNITNYENLASQNDLSDYINKLYEFFNYADIFLCNETIKQDYLKILPNLSKTINITGNSLLNIFKQKWEFGFKIPILIPHDIDPNLEKLLIKTLADSRFLKFEFHVLGNASEKLKENFHCHEDFTLNKLIELIEIIKPKFLFIDKMFNNIFDVLDISFKEKIPCFIKDDEILIDAVDQQSGIVLINTNSIDELYKSLSTGPMNDNYYNLLKGMYNSDLMFNNEINSFTQNLTETYLKYQQELKITRNKKVKSKSQLKKKTDFTNFDGFLSHSYLVPVINAPFSEEEKTCFATMDNIAKYLISKVDKSPEKPFVSIIMPVFNRKEVVLNAINSVLGQTYSNFELIIVDDCSSDGTKELLKTVKHEKIRVFYHETNLGSSCARNTGLNVSKGNIIMYLDSDNEWDSKYVEAMVGSFIELPDADATYSGQIIYNNSEEPISMRFGTYNKSLLHNRNYIDMNCFCHKRHVLEELGGFDENLNRMVDWDFILRISNSFKVYSIPVLLSKYYEARANNRITSNTASNISLFNSNVNYIKKIREKNKLKSNFKGKLNRKVSIIIPNYESLFNLRKCIKSIQKLNYDELIRIIVVDNNSNAAVKFYLKTLQDNNEIDLIQNDINYGFTNAINQGINFSDSDSDILLMTNNALLSKNAIETMQNEAYNIENCGLVAPQQVLPERTPSINVHVPYATNIFDCDITPSMQHDNIINVPTFHDGELLELTFAPYFCTYIKREVLINSVGFDAELGRNNRSNKIFANYIRNIMGLKIYHTSNAIVYHALLKTAQSTNTEQNDSFNLKNQCEDHLLNKLEYKKALWDY